MGIWQGSSNEVVLDLKAEVADRDGNKTEKNFQAIFKKLDVGEREELRKRDWQSDSEIAEDLKKYLTGWAGIIGQDDQPLLFNEENIDLVLSDPECLKPLAAGLVRMLAGKYKEDLAKNSTG